MREFNDVGKIMYMKVSRKCKDERLVAVKSK